MHAGRGGNELSFAAPSAAASPWNDEHAADEWRAYLDVEDDLPVFYPECAEREFGED